MTAIADKLNNDERSAVEIAVQRTFADLNPEERTVAEVAVWRVRNIPSERIAHLAKVAACAIYEERARASREQAMRVLQRKAP